MKGKVTKLTFVLLAVCGFTGEAQAQEPDSSRFGMGMIIGKDTIIHRDIKEVWVYPKRNFTDRRTQKQYYRLVQRVKKVYPYAQKANELLKKYEPQYQAMKSDRDKRKLIKRVQDQLMDEYKDDLKKMSISDGRVLIKLIDRQTGKTSYNIIRELRGGFTAAFWQGIALLFKNNLKDEYDPYGEDMLIENIVILIESGYL